MRHEIGGRRVGGHAPLFVVAELGLNHDGSVDRALAMVDAAAAASASAVKVQTFRAEDLVAADAPAPAHVPEPSLQDFFRRFELDRDAHLAIATRARTHGLAFIATPFSCESVDMLEDVGVDAYKIASGDITFEALIERCASTGKPIVLSTGMATLDETASAVDCAIQAGAGAIALLHCVSAYPVPPGHENLLVIETLSRTFGLPVGLSDHAPDTGAVPMAIALGASLYERHLMLPGHVGVDAAVSSTPAALADVVATAYRSRAALGHGRRECAAVEAKNLIASRRSLHARRPLATGDTLTPADLVALRPSIGLPPGMARELIGSVVTRPLQPGAPIMSDDLKPDWSLRASA